jgi:uncharacterized membrane protein
MPVRPATAVRAIIVAALTGMGALHFTPGPARTMAAIVPPRLRDRPLSAARLVQLTGLCELAGAAGLVLPRTRPAAAALLIAFYAAVFPANAYAARHPERFGPVAVPFWPRLAGQVGIAALTAFAATGGRVSR